MKLDAALAASTAEPKQAYIPGTAGPTFNSVESIVYVRFAIRDDWQPVMREVDTGERFACGHPDWCSCNRRSGQERRSIHRREPWQDCPCNLIGRRSGSDRRGK